MSTLIVIRHAKTEPAASTDFVRELTARGRRDARATGNWLAERGLAADAALVSAARRARQTWVRIADAAGWDVEPAIEPALYSAEVEDVIGRLRLLEGEDTVAVIGHNPTMHALAATLDDGAGDTEAATRLREGYPTSTAAVLDVPVAWADLAPGAGTLRALHTGRG
ncbi:histidine phosphatase family protein [Nocardioides panacisoli]|uniref:SixA phosphatase family protein n=1 Tax=Nocardioides panacisoli TaxID=627624 RepID=UPI001C630C2C|nr:histidine phosphatase family protein [Nocardioides panacisoli]QYJ05007.1 histidine phosphatase family protein [Nocardioides panacisoli]